MAGIPTRAKRKKKNPLDDYQPKRRIAVVYGDPPAADSELSAAQLKVLSLASEGLNVYLGCGTELGRSTRRATIRDLADRGYLLRHTGDLTDAGREALKKGKGKRR